MCERIFVRKKAVVRIEIRKLIINFRVSFLDFNEGFDRCLGYFCLQMAIDFNTSNIMTISRILITDESLIILLVEKSEGIRWLIEILESNGIFEKRLNVLSLKQRPKHQSIRTNFNWGKYWLISFKCLSVKQSSDKYNLFGIFQFFNWAIVP